MRKEDGIRISGYLTEKMDALKNILINDEGDNLYSTNTYIIDKTDNAITIPGIYRNAVDDDEDYSELELTIERKVPDMEYITECNNRLWGCSKDGHEIYASKLGDVKNWNCFRGNSMDSWAATIGSDGKFTGAITFLGYPMFFKEDSLIKIDHHLCSFLYKVYNHYLIFDVFLFPFLLKLIYQLLNYKRN